MAKAVVLTTYGPPDVLVWRDVALPEPGPGQVRIRVKAAGVSPTDAKIRRGDVQAVFPLPPEAILGFEAAGVVDAIGPSVSGVNVGDNVASLLAGLGGYAEYVLASSWTPKPANVTWSDARRPPRSGRSRGRHLEAAPGDAGRDVAGPRCGGLGRDDRHSACRVLGRDRHRRRGAAGPGPGAQPRCCPGHLWRRSG